MKPEGKRKISVQYICIKKKISASQPPLMTEHTCVVLPAMQDLSGAETLCDENRETSSLASPSDCASG